MRKLILLILIVVSALAACGPAHSTTANPTASSSIGAGAGQAVDALHQYFDFLAAGEYERAVALYGGSYDLLHSYNPSLDANDYPTLWRHACEINGFQCLPVREIVTVEHSTAREFIISTSFTTPAGETFALGPCCGEAAATTPVQTIFEFRVGGNAEDGYKVMDLPVYVP